MKKIVFIIAALSFAVNGHPLSKPLEVTVKVVPFIELAIQGKSGSRLVSAGGGRKAVLDFGAIDAFGFRQGSQGGRVTRLSHGGAIYTAEIEVQTRFSGLGRGQGKLKVSRRTDSGSMGLDENSLLEVPAGTNLESSPGSHAVKPGALATLAGGIENSVSSFAREIGVYIRPEDPPGPKQGEIVYTFSIE